MAILRPSILNYNCHHNIALTQSCQHSEHMFVCVL